MRVRSLRSTIVRVCITALLQAQGAQQSVCGFIEEHKSTCVHCGASAGSRSTAKYMCRLSTLSNNAALKAKSLKLTDNPHQLSYTSILSFQ